ncbi:DUF4234 domain-containing protein [Brachyspira pilosicoli]|nr:DUF4234 domain-containing protein [Brachyspira pilosicoli]MBW5400422.1 DUF4234 domain-containing protein [Brachyspira pilosicoli]
MNIIRSIPIMFLLNFITCGIYHYYWIYNVSLEVKKFTSRKDISPELELLLSILTCNIYSIYWYNKYGNIIYKEIALKIDENDKNNVTQIIMVSFIIVLFVGMPIIVGLIFAFVMGVFVSGMSVLYGGAYNNYTLIESISHAPEVLLVFAGTILAVIAIVLVITAMLLIPDIIMQKKLNSIWIKLK